MKEETGSEFTPRTGYDAYESTPVMLSAPNADTDRGLN